jgi:hypothetical protein
LDSQYFYVRLFRLSAATDHQVYLAGDTVTVYYHTQRLDDHKPLSAGNGRYRVTIQRDNGTGFVNELLSQPVNNPSGSFPIELPTTTRPGNYLVQFTYNDTSNAHSEGQTFYIYVGTFNIGADTDRSVYAPGDSVVVSVMASASGGAGSEPTPGVEVTMKIEKYDAGNATWNEDTSFTARKQNTDVRGEVSFLVALPTGIADDTQLRARVSATKGTAQEATTQFTVRAATGLTIDLTLDKTSYKPGETMKARIVFITTNASLVEGSMYEWRISDSSTGRLFVFEYLAGTATGSAKDFPIPADFTGQLYVRVTVWAPDDNSYVRNEYASVFAYSLLINPSKQMYNAGDRIDVSVALVTDRVASSAFYWTVTPGSGGDALAKGSIPAGGKTGTFSFTIPGEPDDSYTISVAAEGRGLVAQDSTEVARAKYTALQITVPDRAFKPGDTVTVHYAFVTVGGATPPTTTTIVIYMGVYPYFVAGSGRSFEVDTSSRMEGDLQYTIPATTASTADVVLTATAGSYGASSTTVFVRPSAGSSPAGGAASTASIGVVLAVLGLALAGFAIMRKPGAPKGESSVPRGGYGDMQSETSKFKVDEKEPPKPADRVMMSDGKGEPPKSL